MKLIHINEAVFNRLLEDNRKPPFQDFYDSVVAFIEGIRKDPIGTVPNETLKGCGLHNGELRKKLYDYGIITKDERIDEPYDETTGRQQSRYYVTYDWSERIKKEMKDKERIGNPTKKAFIRKLYNDLTMGVISDESAPEYVKQATDIYNNKINKNRKKI